MYNIFVVENCKGETLVIVSPNSIDFNKTIIRRKYFGRIKNIVQILYNGHPDNINAININTKTIHKIMSHKQEEQK